MNTSLLPRFPLINAVPRLLILSLSLSALLVADSAHAIIWKGPVESGATGGSGQWTNANFDGATGDVDTFFDSDTTYTSLDTVVTVAAGATARTRALVVRNYLADTTKNVTINLGANSYLHTGRSTRTSGVVNVGGGGLSNPTAPSSSVLTINGPSSGTATFLTTRFYMEGNGTANAGTSHRNSLILNGSGLIVNIDHSFSAVGGASDILFDGGMTVNTLFQSGVNSAGAFHVRTGRQGALYSNWMTVRNATINLHTIDNRGLFQLDRQGSLVATAKTDASEAARELTILVGNADNNAARFEAAGAGIDVLAKVTVFKNATFAIGVSDPSTLQSSGADDFTVSQSFTFNADSLLEFDIFGAGEENADRLIINATGNLVNVGTGTQIVLNLNGYTLQAGDEWSLIDTTGADANWLTGSFNLSLIDTNLWDLSDFNAAGNWTVRSVAAIPEPSTMVLLGLAGMGALGWMKRRRVS